MRFGDFFLSRTSVRWSFSFLQTPSPENNVSEIYYVSSKCLFSMHKRFSPMRFIMSVKHTICNVIWLSNRLLIRLQTDEKIENTALDESIWRLQVHNCTTIYASSVQPILQFVNLLHIPTSFVSISPLSSI